MFYLPPEKSTIAVIREIISYCQQRVILRILFTHHVSIARIVLPLSIKMIYIVSFIFH